MLKMARYMLNEAKLSRILLGIFCILLPIKAEATMVFDRDLFWLAFYSADEVKVVVSDGVKDGCWTNPAAAKTSVELELARSGYKLNADEDSLVHRIVISAIGYATDDGLCFVSYDIALNMIELDTHSSDEIGEDLVSLFYRDVYTTGGIMSGPKSGMNSRLSDALTTLIKGLLVEGEKERSRLVSQLKEPEDEDGYNAMWINYINRAATVK
jgi:hypothetical protein